MTTLATRVRKALIAIDLQTEVVAATPDEVPRA